MTEKKTIGLGKKASAAVETKPVAKTTTTMKVTQPEPTKKAGIGKKAEEVSVKVEVKNVPAIVGYGDRSKDTTKESKTTAKLPAKSSGISSKMEKIKSSMKKVIAHPVKVDEVKEKPVTTIAEVKQDAVNQLDIASTRRPVTAAKKVVVAAGKVSFEEIQQMQASAAPVAPKIPFFDASLYLKK